MTAVPDQPNLRIEWCRWMRIVIVAGVPVGMLVVGVGSRLAMLLLRITSPDTVRGVESDDGFIIGRFTIGGSFALLQIGALVGVLGAMLYLLIRPSLLGPRWFRFVTVGLGSGAVAGSMLLHADGIDFRVLEPGWLAMGLFIAVPFLFGVAVGPAVEMLERRRTPTGWHQFIAPAVALAIGPAGLIMSLVAAPVIFVYTAVRADTDDTSAPVPRIVGQVVRVVWLGIAVLGLVALIGDIRAINRLG
jgi:hypothetical protein